MPRRLRRIPAGSIVHVINRGNDRRLLFANWLDFEEFLSMMRWAKSNEPVRLIAYVVMPNHWHFVIWNESSTQTSRFLHRLTGAHAARIRSQTATTGEGHIYQDRFHGFLIDGEQRYLRLMRYVEANPVRAGLVERAEDWKWSSLSERREPRRGLLDNGPVPLPTDWVEIVNVALPASDLEELRAKQVRSHCSAWDRRPRLRLRRN